CGVTCEGAFATRRFSLADLRCNLCDISRAASVISPAGASLASQCSSGERMSAAAQEAARETAAQAQQAAVAMGRTESAAAEDTAQETLHRLGFTAQQMQEDEGSAAV